MSNESLIIHGVWRDGSVKWPIRCHISNLNEFIKARESEYVNGYMDNGKGEDELVRVLRAEVEWTGVEV